MPVTVDEALRDSLVVNAREVIREFSFQVGHLNTEVRVRLYRSLDGGKIGYRVSHHIHTPRHMDPQVPPMSWGEDEGDAMRLAVSGITEQYRSAMEEGMIPHESWLIPNKVF